MTNTSSNSVSSRRNIFNSATSAHLASMSNSSSSTYPVSSTMPNPPPAMLSGQISASYSRPTTYPLSISTSYASSSSTRAPHHSNYLQTSSTVTSNTSSKQSKLKLPKPKIPEYLADTSFAELYCNSSPFDKNSFENLALPTAWNVDDKCTHLSVDSDKLRVNYIGEIIGSLDLESM
jgi:hypothetical protein